MLRKYEARVARGVALLDERLPGWRDRIDLKKLRLDNACFCVLGQLYAGTTTLYGYFTGIHALRIVGDRRAGTCGFTLFGDEDDRCWKELEDEWKRQILAGAPAPADDEPLPEPDAVLCGAGCE